MMPAPKSIELSSTRRVSFGVEYWEEGRGLREEGFGEVIGAWLMGEEVMKEAGLT
jgi:hypothetical protein